MVISDAPIENLADVLITNILRPILDNQSNVSMQYCNNYIS